jgi:hypothetical protein
MDDSGGLERAGVPHTRRYTARHTAASAMIVHVVDECKRELASIIETMYSTDTMQDKVQPTSRD